MSLPLVSPVRRHVPGLRAAVLALVVPLVFAQSAFAQTATVGADTRQARASIDSNRDGAIDRREAASHPRLAERFDRIDRNHDGRITADERPRHGRHSGHDARRRGGRGEGRRGEGMRGLARLDANGDGRIGRDELAGRERVLAKFAELDGNRDGFLTRGELREFGRKRHEQQHATREQRFAEKFRTIDTDRDGRLSKAEAAGSPRLSNAFAWMDENRDGYLSREELRPQRGR